MLEIINCIQNSAEWLNARCGIITCSEFSKLLAKGEGKTRRTLMRDKAGERMTGSPADSYSNGHMERGKDKEDEIRQLYEDTTGNKVNLCGFMKDGNIGYSPDGLIGDDGLLEAKSRKASVQIELLEKNKVPTENIAQIQGGLYISQRKYLDYVTHCPGLPIFIKRVYPDLEYIENLKKEIDLFEKDLQELIQQIMEKF